LKGRVLEPIQVEQAVHGVKSYFDVHGMTVTRGVRTGGVSADDNFAMLESYHVSGTGDAEKSFMDFGHASIGDEGNFDRGESRRSKAAVDGLTFAFPNSKSDEFAEPRKMEPDGALMIDDA